MIVWLGLRLAVAGGREALLRLTFTAAGVAVGLTLLLLALTGQWAVEGRAERVGWQDAAYAVASDASVDSPVESADGALFLAVSDYHDGTPMTRAYVAALGAAPLVPPGLDRLPGPGEVAASPAMRRLLESTPDDQLDDRLPGRVTMTIGKAGLAHDNALVAIIGRTPDQLRSVQSVREVRGFDTTLDRPLASILQPFLLFGAVLLLVPVVILVVMVTRVAASQREQRLAAIRLVGATRLQTAIVAAAETGLAAVVGAVLAWLAYEAGRRILAATVTFQGGHFWLEDLAVAPGILFLILVGAPVLVMLTAIATLHRVQARPLAISRRGRRRAPSPWTALPVVAGVGGTFALEPLQTVLGMSVEQLSALLTLLTAVGFVLVGPWLCMVISQGVARISRGVPGLIAARRIAADPRATFRAVSGVVLAVAAVTYIGTTTGQLEPLGSPDESQMVRLRPGVVQVYTGGVPTERVAPLLSERTVVVKRSLVVSCAELSRVRHVSCPHPDDSGRIEPAPGGDDLPILEVYIPTDGTLAAENRVRTQAANLVPNAIINTDRDPVDYALETFFIDLGRLASIAGLFVLFIGACSLTAGMIGGLIERRRPFALLRASGMRLGELRRVLFLETAATMVLTSAVGFGLGLVLAYAAARQGGVAWNWPGLDVLAYVGSGVLAALIFSTFALPC